VSSVYISDDFLETLAARAFAVRLLAWRNARGLAPRMPRGATGFRSHKTAPDIVEEDKEILEPERTCIPRDWRTVGQHDP